MNIRRLTKRIVWHHSLADHSSVSEIREWHLQRMFEDIGYHYVIRRDGTIEHGRDTKYIGEHAYGMNHDSVGVCFEGDFRKYEPTVEQLNSACAVYHVVCRAYSKSLEVEFHRSIDNPCPGPLLDREDFREIIKRHDPYR